MEDEGTALYQALPARLRESLRRPRPLREVRRRDGPASASTRPWKETRTMTAHAAAATLASPTKETEECD